MVRDTHLNPESGVFISLIWLSAACLHACRQDTIKGKSLKAKKRGLTGWESRDTPNTPTPSTVNVMETIL